MHKKILIFYCLLYGSAVVRCSEKPSNSFSRYVPSAEQRAQILSTSGELAYTIGSNLLSAGCTAVSFVIKATKKERIENDKGRPQLKQSRHVDFNAHSCSDSDSDAESGWESVEQSTTKFTQSFFRDEAELQESLKTSPCRTLDKFNQFAQSCYEDTNSNDSARQTEISRIFKLTQKVAQTSGQNFSLAPIIADLHNKQQRDILETTLELHATILEPQYKEDYKLIVEKAAAKRDAAISIAENQFNKEKKHADKKLAQQLVSSLTTVAITASNSHYINNCAQNKLPHDAHDTEHFATTESYQNLLAQIRTKKVSTDATKF